MENLFVFDYEVKDLLQPEVVCEWTLIHFLEYSGGYILNLSNNKSGETKKIPVALLLAIGGHTFEALALFDRISHFVNVVYLVQARNTMKKSKIRIPGPIYTIKLCFGGIRAKNIARVALEGLTFLSSVFIVIRILRKEKIKAFIAVGSGYALAPILAAKILGIKVIFVESACRVESRSLCGNLTYKFFADQFIVQWEEQLRVYPKAIYAGRLF